MKRYALLLTLFLAAMSAAMAAPRLSPDWGKPVKIDPSTPPSGMHMIQILLENQSLPLKGTGCNTDPGDKRTLQHQLALVLGGGLDDKERVTTLSGQCKAEKFELRSGAIVDAWLCTLYVMNKARDAEEDATSSINFAVNKKTWKIFPETLLCL